MHGDVLGEREWAVWDRLVSAGLLSGFYLGGGTAAALHLGHRLSHDLDWFTPAGFPGEELAACLGGLGAFAIHARTAGSLHGSLDGVRLSFLHYPYPLLDAPVAFRGAAVAGLRDIALMKLNAIAGRGGRRDFYDLHAICHHGLALGDLLADLPRKFGPGVNVYHVLKSLTYFDDAEADPEPLLRVSLRWEEVKAFFLREAPKYVG